jgi:hypothetical protein
MNDYHIAAALNNEGAVAIEDDLGASMGLFRRAIAALQDHLTDENEDARHEGEQVGNITEFTQYVMNSTFLQAIRLMPSVRAYSPDPLVNAGIACAIVIFNTAIVSNRQALLRDDEERPDSNRMLRRAQSLYLMAQRTLQDQGVAITQCSGLGDIDLMVMAMLHNLGQISHILSDSEGCTTNCMNLLTFADTVDPRSYNGADEMDVVLQWYKDVFMRSADVLQRRMYTAATA